MLGCDSRSCSERMHASAFSLETSMPTILPCCGILPLPSLLVRALAPTQLFGLKSSDGRLLMTTARLHTLPYLPDTRGWEAQGVPFTSPSPALWERGDPARAGWVSEAIATSPRRAIFCAA